MLIRFLSTVFLAPPFIAAIWLGYPYFESVICLIGLLGLIELLLITGVNTSKSFIIFPVAGLGLGFVFCILGEYNFAIVLLTIGGGLSILYSDRGLNNKLYSGFGCVYIFLASFSLIEMRNFTEFGIQITVWFFLVIWANDIGAYIVGTILKGPSIFPTFSPGKTWAGSIGGVIIASSIALLFRDGFLLGFDTVIILLSSAVLAIVAQLGDLIESIFKRHYKLKNSGNIIPGHGGVLDRFDSVFLAAPVTMCFLFIYVRDGT